MLENDLETACLNWLSDLDYECLTGDDVSAGGSHEARRKYLEVLLRPRLHEALDRLNPSLPSSALENAWSPCRGNFSPIPRYPLACGS
ncbi:hypothetical protein [Thiolapillus sp.]|uniref:hypothetical protein n=1 Tax=Thiolapillus sp. TaxID=2017437 RepID=UPI003AF57D8B